MKPNYFVFHGTSEKNLRVIAPVLIEGHDRPFVFASRYKAMAACFLLPKDPEWMCVFYTQNGDVRFVADNQQKLEKADKGGSIYTLSAADFYMDEREGMEYMEWLAPRPQQVVHESTYSSAVHAMRVNGVKIFHIAPHLFKTLRERLGSDPFILCTDQQMQQVHEFLNTHHHRWAA